MNIENESYRLSRKCIRIISILIVPLVLCLCNVIEDKKGTLLGVSALNNEIPKLIDRGEIIGLLFEVTPKDYPLSKEQISISASDCEDVIKLADVEGQGEGLYCAYIEDLDTGTPWRNEIRIRVRYERAEGEYAECESDPFIVIYAPYEYDYSVIANDTIYDCNSHAAFTGLINFNGELYLAFRDGNAHRPATMEDYGVIKILVNDGSGWKENATIKDETKDLRDPFLIDMGGKLRVYIGYNTFEGGQYQHSGSVYADLDNGQWSEVRPLVHDVPHVVWLWKVRKYADKYYSVAYLEGEYPVLLSSSDGVHWQTVTFFELAGELSEADLGFIGKTMFVCLRKDKPVGTPSYWGVSEYPFLAFSWEEMDICVESPEFLRLPFSNSLLLAGRERYQSSEEVSVSLYCATMGGELKRVAIFDTGVGGDKGYPGLTVKDGLLYCSYYTGLHTDSQIRMASLRIIEKN